MHSSDEFLDYYDILGINETASLDELKSVYRNLALQYHPDRHIGSSSEKTNFLKIKEAYEVLADPETRKTFDIFRKQNRIEIMSVDTCHITEFLKNEDDEYFKICRCGEFFRFHKNDILNGITIIPCDGCSLYIGIDGIEDFADREKS